MTGYQHPEVPRSARKPSEAEQSTIDAFGMFSVEAFNDAIGVTE